MTKYDLEGKTFLVTGASSGIGKQVAIDISQNEGTVIITGREETRLSETRSLLKGSNHLSLPADLTDEQQIDALVDRLPKLSGIVHSAGITGHVSVRFIRNIDIDKYFRINYNAPVLLTSKIIARKKMMPVSSIVFMSSAASRIGFAGGALYAGTKSALESYAKALAVEQGKKGIRANCISPSFVKTPMLDQMVELATPEIMSQFERLHTLGFGTPEDVSNAAMFLLSDESRWITGSVMVMGGI
jgi:NAD(P)-dependent dehydrogenase (short-subunit alcohol dehydrogenase family)